MGYKTVPCKKYWTVGHCEMGPRCVYIHQEVSNAMAKQIVANNGELPPSVALSVPVKPVENVGAKNIKSLPRSGRACSGHKHPSEGCNPNQHQYTRNGYRHDNCEVLTNPLTTPPRSHSNPTVYAEWAERAETHSKKKQKRNKTEIDGDLEIEKNREAMRCGVCGEGRTNSFCVCSKVFCTFKKG